MMSFSHINRIYFALLTMKIAAALVALCAAAPANAFVAQTHTAFRTSLSSTEVRWLFSTLQVPVFLPSLVILTRSVV